VNTPTHPHEVFVYGPLQSGEAWHVALTGAHWQGDGCTRAEFDLLDLGPFPALASGGTHQVAGECYRLTDAQLARIDALQGHPEFNRRQQVTLDDGRQMWTWVLHPQRRHPDMRVLVSRRWKRKPRVFARCAG
jgi:hypothetical protein